MSKERDLLVSCLDEFQYHEVPCSDLIRTIQWLLNEPEQTEKEPVGIVRTIGGYPDQSEHTVELTCRHGDLRDGDLLYTSPPNRAPLSDDKTEELLTQFETKQEPVAWLWEELDSHAGEWYGGCVDDHKPPEHQHRRNIRPLYTAPPKREPIELIDLDKVDKHLEICDKSEEYRDGYSDGIVFTERHHGMRGQHE